MKRFVTTGAKVALALVLVVGSGLSGCGGDDDAGMPKDLTPAKPDLDMTTKIGKMNDAMKAAKKGPQPGALP